MGDEQDCCLFAEIAYSLEGNATKWWQLIKSDVQNCSQFWEEFLNKFWNRDVQKRAQQKLKMEQYRPGKKWLGNEYFIESVLMMKPMILEPPEEDIIATLTEYFDKRVQDAQKVQNGSTIKSLQHYYRKKVQMSEMLRSEEGTTITDLKATITLHHH